MTTNFKGNKVYYNTENGTTTVATMVLRKDNPKNSVYGIKMPHVIQAVTHLADGDIYDKNLGCSVAYKKLVRNYYTELAQATRRRLRELDAVEKALMEMQNTADSMKEYDPALVTGNKN